MTTKNWRQVGRVTVLDCRLKRRTFDTLEQAVRYVGYDDVLALTRHDRLGVVAYTSSALLARGLRTWTVAGASHLFYDELGLVIPVWRVREEALNMCWTRRMYWRSRHVKPEHYRRYPVPYTRSFRGGRHFRGIRTAQEIRENDFLQYDEDARELGLLARGRRRRGRLPTLWDDVCRGRPGNSWKHHREHQWKE